MKPIIKYEKDTTVEFIQPDYKGITEMLDKFVKLYDVCGDKKVIDDILKRSFRPTIIIKDFNI